MTDLISRQAAIDIVQQLYPGIPRVPWLRKEWKKRYEPYIRVENAIRELPSAQPERKKGKWIKMSDADGVYYCCSECGEKLYRKWSFDRDYDLFPKKESIERTNFCPNCGADMRDGEDFCSYAEVLNEEAMKIP